MARVPIIPTLERIMDAEHDAPDGWREIEGGPEQREPRVKYLNVYDVDRCYGGPEEGGWWYDAGIVLASVPFVVAEASDEWLASEKVRLRELFGGDGKHRRSSVLGGSDVEVYVEEEVAEAFPKKRPHYE